MLEERFVCALRLLYEGLEDTAVAWAITGSCGFALQSVPVIPNDIDVQTGRDGAYAIAEQFVPYVVDPVVFRVSPIIKSYFGRLMVEGVQVEIMGDVQKRVNGRWEPPVDILPIRQFVQIENMALPVLSLAYEYEAYRQLGQVEKAEMLLPWVNSRFVS